MSESIMNGSASVNASHRSGHRATPPSAELLLISGLRDRTEASYEELLLRIEKVVTPLLPRLMAVLHDKDDLVQNVALKVFLCISRFRGECALNSWIYRIAINEIHNCGRWLTRHRLCEAPEPLQGLCSRSWIENVRDPGPSPFAGAAERQVNGQIMAALSTLPSVYQEALFLRVLYELSYEEIASRLNISVAIVKFRIFSARRRLRSSSQLKSVLRPRAKFNGSE